ncbi:hypothetical protein BGZ58_001875, partial [Dissophora ornata]
VAKRKASDKASLTTQSTLSSPISKSSSSSSSVSSSILTPGTLDRMRAEFATNFKEYRGAPWLLSSGTNVDEVIYQHVMMLDVESTLHSFILDQTGSVMQCFEEEDQAHFQAFVDSHDTGLSVPLLSEWMREEILRYSLAPEALQDQLSHGWKHPGQDNLPTTVVQRELDGFRKVLYRVLLCLSCLYEDHNNSLPESQSESWYATEVWAIFVKLLVGDSEWLEYEPGEVCSSASSHRKNKGRELDTRHAQGNKIDGLIACRKTRSEIGAMEIGKVDDGATGTKVLKDGRKLAKLLKDMFDHIYSQSYRASEVKDTLQVYGLLVSGLRVEFVSMGNLKGRYYRLRREHAISVPSKWTDTSIRRILVVVTKFLLLRKRMEEMAKLVEDWSNPSVEELEDVMSGLSRPSTPPIPTRTLSSPKKLAKAALTRFHFDSIYLRNILKPGS